MLAPRARAGWSSPFRLSAPGGIDLLAPQIAFSSAGDSLVAFGAQNEDAPAVSSGSAVLRLASGRLHSPRAVPGASEVLAVGFDGADFVLLTGVASAGAPCCASAQLARMTPAGTYMDRRALVGQLAGPTAGSLAALGKGSMLAAVAGSAGVFAVQSTGSGRFGSVNRVSAAGDQPEAVATTAVGTGRGLVAWTAATPPEDGGGPRSISIATGSPGHSPSGRRAAVTVAQGHRIDELALAAARPSPTAAWIESWYDAGGGYHSEPVVADLGRAPVPHAVAATGEVASGLSLAANAAGAQVLAWKECTVSATCQVLASTRDPGGRFAAPVTLGLVDAGEVPAATVAAGGEEIVGWVDAGNVVVADRSRAGRFSPPRLVSATSSDSGLTLAFGPRGEALAAWIQGTMSPVLEGAAYRAG